MSAVRRVRLAGAAVPYRLVRTPFACAIRIRVGAEGVVVSAPPRTRVRAIEGALRAHADWIGEALAAVPPSPGLSPGALVPLLDGWVRIGEDVPVPAGADPLQAAEAWYRDAARTHFRPMMDAWAERMDVAPRRLVVRGQRSRWGSASARGEISVNWRMMMAPAAVGEYVVVHELAHLVHMDHSARFWELVGRHLPGHAREREWLRVNGDRLMGGHAAVAAGAGGVG